MMPHLKKTAFGIVVAVGLLVCAAKPDNATLFFALPLEMKAALTGDKPLMPALREQADLWEFYTREGFAPQWITPQGALSHTEEMLKLLSSAEDEGLNPADYAIAKTSSWKNNELQLSRSALRYIRHLAAGRIDPATMPFVYAPLVHPPSIAPSAVLAKALEAESLSGSISSHEPPGMEYSGLKSMLATYRGYFKDGEWPVVPMPAVVIVPGAHDPLVPALRRVMNDTGYIDTDETAGDFYNQPLADAVRRLKQDYPLRQDGVIDRFTLIILNMKREEGDIIPYKGDMAPGANDPRVNDVRKELVSLGYLPDSATSANNIYNPEMVKAVTKLQNDLQPPAGETVEEKTIRTLQAVWIQKSIMATEGKVIALGESDARIPAIRHRLIDIGVLKPYHPADPLVLDPPLADAVRQLQSDNQVISHYYVSPNILQLLNSKIKSSFPLPLYRTILPGEKNDIIPLLRARLRREGYGGTDGQSSLYDDALADTVGQFQARHGLTPSRAIDPPTLAAMNVPLAFRIEQIVASMERLRWFTPMDSDYSLRVNLPAYSLTAYEHDKAVFSMKAIIGNATYDVTHTPIMQTVLYKFTIHPLWEAPRRLLLQHLAPSQALEPDYLNINGFRLAHMTDPGEYTLLDDKIVNWKDISDRAKKSWTAISLDEFPYTVLQQAVDNNPMGKVRFYIKNDLNIFLHDTPGKQLFKDDMRDLSSGCIRLSDALRLAHWLVQHDPHLTLAAFDADYNKTPPPFQTVKDEHFVELSSPVPIVLEYRTAWQDEHGAAHFAEDIYHVDKLMESQMKSR